MAADAELVVEARMTDNISGTLQRMGGAFNRFSSRVGSGIRNITTQMSSFRNIIAGAAMIKAIDVTVGAYARLEAQMMTVAGLSEDVANNLGAFTNDIMKLSSQTGQSLDVLTKSLFDSVSAGVSAGEAMEFLATASQLAIGGATETSVAVDGLTSILNAYGLATTEATDVADAFFTAQKFGKTTVAELASTVGTVAPIAKAAGVGFDSLLAALSAMTKGGIATVEASTMMRGALTQLSKLSPEARTQMQALGLEYEINAEKGVGVADVFANITKAAGGTLEGMIKLIPDIKAAAGILALGGQNAKIFREALAELEKRAGSSEKAFEQMQSTMSQVSKQLKQEFTIGFIQAGAQLAPVFQEMMENSDGAMGGIQFGLKMTGAVIADILNGIKMAFQGVTVFLTTVIAGWSAMINAAVQAMPDSIIPKGWKSSMADWVERSMMAADKSIKDFTASADKAAERGSAVVNVFKEGANGGNNFATSVLNTNAALKQLNATTEASGGGTGSIIGLADPEKMQQLISDLDTLRNDYIARTIKGQLDLLDQEEELLQQRIETTIDNELGRQLAWEQVEGEFNARRSELIEKQFDNEEAIAKAHNAKLAIIDKQRVSVAWRTTSEIISVGNTLLQANRASGNVMRDFAMAEAAINGARAVTAAYASPPGPPWTIPLAGLIGVKTGLQVSMIRSQKFASGGFPTGRNAMVQVNERGPEAILNAPAVNREGHGNINAMNSGIHSSGRTTNEISYSPTYNITSTTSRDIIDALSRDRMGFSNFMTDLSKRGFNAN